MRERYALTDRGGAVPGRPIDPRRRARLVAFLRWANLDPDALLADARAVTRGQAHDGRYQDARGRAMLHACAVQSVRAYMLAHDYEAAAAVVREASETEVSA
jgi:hypothetical protein